MKLSTWRAYASISRRLVIARYVGESRDGWLLEWTAISCSIPNRLAWVKEAGGDCPASSGEYQRNAARLCQVVKSTPSHTGGRACPVVIRERPAKLPVAELKSSLEVFVAPLAEMLPNRRLQRVLCLAVRGFLGGQTPVVTATAQSFSRLEGGT